MLLLIMVFIKVEEAPKGGNGWWEENVVESLVATWHGTELYAPMLSSEPG